MEVLSKLVETMSVWGYLDRLVGSRGQNITFNDFDCVLNGLSVICNPYNDTMIVKFGSLLAKIGAGVSSGVLGTERDQRGHKITSNDFVCVLNGLGII